MSDNGDHYFGTFDDFGVKNDQKVSHNMILMSKYKGQHGGKKVNKFGQCPKENIFFQEGFPNVGVSRGSLDAIFRFDKSLNLTNNFS